MSFTIIDLETTGLSKHSDKITEIAAAKIKDGVIVDRFHTLINPEVEIPEFIVKLTGIDNELVKNAPTIDVVLPDFLQFLQYDIFVAHNATFDFGFLEKNLQEHYNITLKNETLCTRKLANRLYGDLPRKRLKDLCKHLEIENTQAHRAMSDVEATVGVFNQMLILMSDRGLTDLSKIIDFEKAKIGHKN